MKTMARVDHTTSYYQKMAELQEKLKRSEEERLRLEEKFAVMIKSCREEEEKRIRALRERYEKFLDDDKRRRDRNERILQTLEKIENRATSLSAKSERLKLLRKHYEAYLVRMYPLWKKHPGPVTQPSVPVHYPLTIPMETEKGLPWFGSNGSLYANNVPFPSVQSSQSPGSDHLWVPPIMSKNVPSYDITKQHVLEKPTERRQSVVESSIPAVDNALDNYLQRAAELLRVPVEELEGQSEKCDEEKSVHTEQDTSRDLLNISFSDDGILNEKKNDKTAGNVAILKTNENEKVIEENKLNGFVNDYLAGGDNILTERQKTGQTVLHKQDKFESSDQNVKDKNELNAENNRTEIAEENKELQNIDRSVENNEQESVIFDDKFEFGHEEESANQCYRVEEPEANASQYNDGANMYQEQIMNSTLEQDQDLDNVYESVGQPESVEQLADDSDHQLIGVDKGCFRKAEHSNYIAEQETLNQEQRNVGQSESYIDLQLLNNPPQEYSENRESSTGELEEKQLIYMNEEADMRNDSKLIESAELQHSDVQEYASQNTVGQELCVQNDNPQYDQEQYEQEQYKQQQYEQELYNQQQYEQEQYNQQQYEQEQYNQQQYEQEQYNQQQYQQEEYDPDRQPYDQQNLEQYGYEQYVDNTVYEQNPPIDTDSKYADQRGDNNVQNEGQYKSPNKQNDDIDLAAQGQLRNVDQGFDFQSDVPVKSDNAPHQNVEVGEIELTEPEATVSDDQVPIQNKVEHQQVIPQQENLEKQVTSEKETEQQMIEDHIIDGNHDESDVSENQHLGGGLTTHTPVTVTQPGISSNIEEESEDSSAGFWNPPHHSSIPSVDELAPKTKTVAADDTSESSVDLKAELSTEKLHGSNTKMQLSPPLGVTSDPSGDLAISDQDEVEDQLAALVEDSTVSARATVGAKQEIKIKEIKQTKQVKASPTLNKVKSITKEPLKSKLEKDSKTKKKPESAKPSARTGLKKPPSLIKVLESDSESLHLDSAGASNVDSDEFDFSTE